MDLKKSKVMQFASKFRMFIILIVVMVVLGIVEPKFLNLGNFSNIFKQVATNAILAAGMCFVILTGGIDISVGAVVAISAAVVCMLIGGRGDGVPEHSMVLAMLAAVLVGILCGVWNGFLVAKLKIQAVVATLILMTAGRGVAQLMTEGQIITVYYKPFSYIAGTIPGNVLPTNIFIAAAMVLLVVFLMKKTSIGLFVQSVGINPNASRFSGINVTMVIFLVYAFSGFCAGVSGLLESSLIRAADANNAGLNMEMDAILAVALGGTLLSGGKFYIGGSVIGAITIQTLTTTMYALGVSADQLPVVKAIAVVIICLIQSKRCQEMFDAWKAHRHSSTDSGTGEKAVDKA